MLLLNAAAAAECRCCCCSCISPIPDLKIPSFCPEILHTGSLRVVDIGPVIEIVKKQVAPHRANG
jgi:hypothetical protein